MGWADCGNDSKGRPIGYGFPATCDHQGCSAEIDRGLSYACGGMHGDNDPDGSCEGYFCPEHLATAVNADGDCRSFCFECAKLLPDEEEGD